MENSVWYFYPALFVRASGKSLCPPQIRTVSFIASASPSVVVGGHERSGIW